jgi:Domain of unknown function (DUF4129)
MKAWQPGSGFWSEMAGKAAWAGALLAVMSTSPAAYSQVLSADAGMRTVSLDEYRQHLEQLKGVVSDCAAQQKLKNSVHASDDACDPQRVGPDDRVQWGAGAAAQTREVRYDWLRAALARAGKKASATTSTMIGASTAGKAKAPSVDQVLAEAQQRLKFDADEAASPAGAGESYAAERKTLNTILAEKAYRGVGEMSPRERFVEWLDNLLDRFFASLVRLGSRAPWIGWVLLGLLLVGVGVALLWLLIRIERNARVRLIPDVVVAPGAPSAREWQLWLKDAQDMAAKGFWREAIHFLYWAAIARLESRRLWPADRTRTPREYLALVAGSDPRKANLTELTRRFERTWYGGRAAGAADFHAAMELASSLGVATE